MIVDWPLTDFADNYLLGKIGRRSNLRYVLISVTVALLHQNLRRQWKKKKQSCQPDGLEDKEGTYVYKQAIQGRETVTLCYKMAGGLTKFEIIDEFFKA